MKSYQKGTFIFLVIKVLILTFIASANSEESFNSWLISYKKFAMEKGISEETVNVAFKNVKFLEQVIKYDRKQPEFYEDTNTYVKKRANTLRATKAKQLLKKNKNLFY